MTLSTTAEVTRAIALEQLQVSTTGSQVERRAHFNKAAIAELAESIKTVGLLSPIIARPVNGHFEVVAGERRYMAAKAAGMSAINVTVRELTDEQVLEIQLVENLQREGLHELAEAEGYDGLVNLGHNVDDIAAKTGKSRAYIYARMKLLALCADARKAFYAGKFPASTALLLARIPMPIQADALKEMIDNPYDDAPMSFREVKRLIHETYMLRLSHAGFPTADETLVAAAGACGTCPKRTGNQPELFDDVKGKDVCTDPVCFKSKRQAHAVRAIAQAKETGQAVITGNDAKKVMPYSSGQVASGYAKLTDKCYEDKKQRTYGQLLGKDFKPTLVQDPQSGALVKVVPPAAIKEALEAAGVKARSSRSNPQSAAEKKAKLEKRFRAALYSEMREKFPAKLGDDDLRTIALRFFEEMTNDTQKLVLGLWQWEPVKSKNGYGLDLMTPVTKGLADMDDAQVTKFLFDLVFVNDIQVFTWSDRKPTRLLATAKKLKIDPEKIRRQLNAASITKAKKKAARKSK